LHSNLLSQRRVNCPPPSCTGSGLAAEDPADLA
jgi:hypothetical protein